jgi:hypothetical protein
VLVHPLQRLFCGLQRLCGSTLCGGHRG